MYFFINYYKPYTLTFILLYSNSVAIITFFWYNRTRKSINQGGTHYMAKCYVTGLGPKAGNNRSHSLQASRRTWKPNLQKVRIKDEKGHVIRVYVSTRALRTGLKNGSIERA